MSGLTPRIGLIKPVTGEPDLAQDVATNMDTLDATALDPAQYTDLTDGGSADTQHTHDEVESAKYADAAGVLDPGNTINGVLFDGSAPIVVTANPNAHTHHNGDLVDIVPPLQLRRIFVGTSTNPAIADPTPQTGDLYIRIR